MPQSIGLQSFLLQRQDLTSKALGPRVTLTAAIQPDLPPLFVDPALLELALLNLIVNARDARDKHLRHTSCAIEGPALPT